MQQLNHQTSLMKWVSHAKGIDFVNVTVGSYCIQGINEDPLLAY